MSIVIVQGTFFVKPGERDRFLETSTEGIRSSRLEKGCLEYVLAADPIDPGRVVLSERWESMDDLQEHMHKARAKRSASQQDADSRPAPVSQEITVYEVVETRALG